MESNSSNNILQQLQRAVTGGLSPTDAAAIHKMLVSGDRHPRKKQLSKDERKKKRKAQKLARRKNRHVNKGKRAVKGEHRCGF